MSTQCDQISAEDRILFQTVARVIVVDDRGSHASQIEQAEQYKEALVPLLPALTSHLPALSMRSYTAGKTLLFFNGTGWFLRRMDGNMLLIHRKIR